MLGAPQKRSCATGRVGFFFMPHANAAVSAQVKRAPKAARTYGPDLQLNYELLRELPVLETLGISAFELLNYCPPEIPPILAWSHLSSM